MQLWQGDQAGADQEATKGTAYGLLNAVGEYIDHERPVQATCGRSHAEARMDAVMFNAGARRKQSAYGLMTRVLEIDPEAAAKDQAVEDLMSQIDV